MQQLFDVVEEMFLEAEAGHSQAVVEGQWTLVDQFEDLL